MPDDTTARAPVATTGPEEADVLVVEAFFQALAKALRTYHLYQGAGTSYDRFLQLLHTRTSELWDHLADLSVRIEEASIHWQDRIVYETDERADSIAFLLHRDGLRELQIFPGFEDEIQEFLPIIGRVQHTSAEAEDDLITLLWDRNFTHLRYRYVDATGEGASLTQEPEERKQEPVSSPTVRAEVSSAPSATISADDFDASLYFLEDHELRLLREEIDREAARDLWADTASALFDRLDDGSEDRKRRIVAILCDILPEVLRGGRVSVAADVVRALVPFVDEDGGKGGDLSPELRQTVRDSVHALATADTILQLVTVLEEAREDVPASELATLLGHLPPAALGPILRAEGRVASAVLRASLGTAIETMATKYPETVVELTADPEEEVAGRAILLLGRTGAPGAARTLRKRLGHPSARVRLAVVEALQSIRSAEASQGIVTALEDASRDVRVRAVRAIGSLKFDAALDQIRKAVASKRMREVDLTERIAFFEVLGTLGTDQDIRFLNGLLNGKRLLGRREPPELRACAALALGRIGTPDARQALERARDDDDPVVRNAVGKAARERVHV